MSLKLAVYCVLIILGNLRIVIAEDRPPPDFHDATPEEKDVVDQYILDMLSSLLDVRRLASRVHGYVEACDLRPGRWIYEKEFVFSWSDDFESDSLRLTYASRLVFSDKKVPTLGGEVVAFTNPEKRFDLMSSGGKVHVVGDVFNKENSSEESQMDRNSLGNTAFNPFAVCFLGVGSTKLPTLKTSLSTMEFLTRVNLQSKEISAIYESGDNLIARWTIPQNAKRRESGAAVVGYAKFLDLTFDKTWKRPIAVRMSVGRTAAPKSHRLMFESSSAWSQTDGMTLPTYFESRELVNIQNPDDGYNRIVADFNWSQNDRVGNEVFDVKSLGVSLEFPDEKRRRDGR